MYIYYYYVNYIYTLHYFNIDQDDQAYTYISKVHRHSFSRISNPSTIPWRAKVRVAANMFKSNMWMGKSNLLIKYPLVN